MFVFVVAIMLVLMIWMERKASAYIQDRRGPNRTNILGIRLFGIIQNVADVVKLVTKEDAEPDAADKILFRLAPFIVMFIALMTMAVIPFAEPVTLWGHTFNFQISGLNAGILYVFALSSLGVYGTILAGWSSGNKYSFLGAVRASSQMISYEVGLGLAVVGVLLAYGTTDLAEIVARQGHLPWGWGVAVSPLGFLIFWVGLFAETGRVPFDLPEGESELVAGFHLEYSGLKFALFFMGEYVNMVVGAAIISTLFFGGWQVPFLSGSMIEHHAQTILSILLIVGGVGLMAIFFIILHSILKPFVVWKDLRDNEPKYFAPIVFILAVAMLWSGIWLATGPSLAEASWYPILQGGVKFVLQVTSFSVKTFFFSFLFIWVRWTLPRFRYDQVMRLGWQYLLPLGVFNIFLSWGLAYIYNLAGFWG